jgi:hypothetical protein
MNSQNVKEMAYIGVTPGDDVEERMAAGIAYLAQASYDCSGRKIIPKNSWCLYFYPNETITNVNQFMKASPPDGKLAEKKAKMLQVVLQNLCESDLKRAWNDDEHFVVEFFNDIAYSVPYDGNTDGIFLKFYKCKCKRYKHRNVYDSSKHTIENTQLVNMNMSHYHNE